MSQETVDFVRSQLDQFIRTGDLDPEDFDDGFEFDNSNAMMAADIYRGPEGVREYFSLLRQIWDRFTFEPEEYISAGEEQVVVPIRILAVGRDGIETVAHSAIVYTVRGGKLAYAKAFQTKADALEAVS